MINEYINDINMVKDFEANIEKINSRIRKNIKLIEIQIKEKKHKKGMGSPFGNKSFTFGEYKKWRELNDK